MLQISVKLTEKCCWCCFFTYFQLVFIHTLNGNVSERLETQGWRVQDANTGFLQQKVTLTTSWTGQRTNRQDDTKKHWRQLKVTAKNNPSSEKNNLKKSGETTKRKSGRVREAQGKERHEENTGVKMKSRQTDSSKREKHRYKYTRERKQTGTGESNH